MPLFSMMSIASGLGELWWLVVYDEDTATASRAVAVVGVADGGPFLAWIEGASMRPTSEAEVEAVRPAAVVRAGGEVTLALIQVDRSIPGPVEQAVEMLAAAAGVMADDEDVRG